MNNIMTIAGRQFRSYINSPIAYIVVCVVLVLLGIFFWSPFFLFGRATARRLFEMFALLNYIAIPALTMGLLAEERRTGTIELLITMPVTEAQVIIGKFLGVFALYLLMVGLTLPYPISISSLGNLDSGPVIAGYIGLILQGAALIGIGLMASSLTSSQVIALFVAWAIALPLLIIDWFLPLMEPGLVSVFEPIAFGSHLESFRKGVVKFKDLIYFVTVAAVTLAISFRALESRRWS